MPPVHTDKDKSPVARDVRNVPKRNTKKGDELVARHFTGCHRELSVLKPAVPHDLADRQIVGRIRESQVGQFTCEQPTHSAFVASVAAKQPMPSQLVKVTQSGYRRLRNSHRL